YRSPELLTAPDAAHASADFYSLSAMFYELLVNVVPTGFWQPPSEMRPDVPKGVDKLIERGLSNNPRNRPQTAAEFLSALDEATNAAPKHDAKPTPVPPPPPKQPEPVIADVKGPTPAPPPAAQKPKNRTLQIIIGIVVAILGIFGIIGGIQEMTGG